MKRDKAKYATIKVRINKKYLPISDVRLDDGRELMVTKLSLVSNEKHGDFELVLHLSPDSYELALVEEE